MIRRLLVNSHFAIYQTLLGLIGVVAVIRILCDYTWKISFFYGVATILSFWAGQGVVSVVQRIRARRSESVD